MTFIVLFEDNPAADPGLRQAHMAAHKAFLEETGTVTLAGPLAEGGVVSGGLWVVAAETAEAVEALVRADPFFSTGLRKSWRVLSWTQVYRRP